MPKWIVALFVLGCLCTPDLALARSDQERVATGSPEASLAASSLDGEFLGIPEEQAVVVGTGIVAGALVLHLVLPGEITYLAGGVVGGLAALWWYGNTHDRPKLKLERARTLIDASTGPVLEGAAPTP